MNDNYNFKEALDDVLNKVGTNNTINTILNKPQYKCGVCGRIYDSISERAECELKCLKLKEEEDKKAAEEKKKNEQKARRKEVDDAMKKAQDLMSKYIEDYGIYDYKTDYTNDVFSDPFFFGLLNLLP